jgi:Fic family protein
VRPRRALTGPEVRELERKLRGRDDLNSRQIAILNDARRHPGARMTIDGHRTLARVVYQTARTDLLGLAALGYLEQFKIGKKLSFIPVRDLARTLKPLT